MDSRCQEYYSLSRSNGLRRQNSNEETDNRRDSSNSLIKNYSNHNLNPGSTSSMTSKNKKVWDRKNINSKLQKLIKQSCKPANNSNNLLSQHHYEGSLPFYTQTRSHLKSILERFSSYIKTISDGNAYYRILGIHHIRHILSSQDGDAFLNNLIDQMNMDSFDFGILKKVPQTQLPAHLFKKSKIIQIYKSLITGIRKKMEVTKDYFKSVASILNTYTIFDLALVTVYRLLVYYRGFKQTARGQSEYIDGNEGQMIVNFDSEAIPNIVQLLAECFKCEISEYSLNKLEITLLRYGLNRNSPDDSIVVQDISRSTQFSFCVLKSKEVLNILYQEDNKPSNNRATPTIIESGNQSVVVQTNLPINDQISKPPEPAEINDEYLQQKKRSGPVPVKQRRLTEDNIDKNVGLPTSTSYYHPQVKHRYVNTVPISNKPADSQTNHKKNVMAGGNMKYPLVQSKKQSRKYTGVVVTETPKKKETQTFDQDPTPKKRVVVSELAEQSILRQQQQEEEYYTQQQVQSRTRLETIDSNNNLRRVGSISKQKVESSTLKKQQFSNKPFSLPSSHSQIRPIDNSEESKMKKYMLIKKQEQEFYEQIYTNMSDKEKKTIVIEHLRKQFQTRYEQVKANQESEIRRKVQANHKLKSDHIFSDASQKYSSQILFLTHENKNGLP